MYINFSQLIETTYYSVMEALKKITKEESLKIRKVSIEIPFTLDIYQKKGEPLERIPKHANSCSKGLKNQHDELKCCLTINLKRRGI